jgi:antitoxin ParD1/3/4
MNIYLGEHFDAFVRAQVATGRFANASEVVRESLRRYEDYETKLAVLRLEVQLGLDSNSPAGHSLRGQSTC